MENVINRILEIDKRACEKIQNAEKQKKQILIDAKNEEVNIRETHLKNADFKIFQVDEQAKKIADQKISKIEQDKMENISRLHSIYDQYHNSWEQDIINRIVGE